MTNLIFHVERYLTDVICSSMYALMGVSVLVCVSICNLTCVSVNVQREGCLWVRVCICVCVFSLLRSGKCFRIETTHDK